MDELLMKISELTGDSDEVMELLRQLKEYKPEDDGRLAALQVDFDNERAKSERLEAETDHRQQDPYRHR